MPKKQKKVSFTLLEILIAATILSLVLTVGTIQGAKLIRAERFERALEMISDQIDYAYELNLLTQADLIMHLEKQGKELRLTFHIKGQNDSKKLPHPKKIEGIEKMKRDGQEVLVLDLLFSKDYPESSTQLAFEGASRRHLFDLKGVL